MKKVMFSLALLLMMPFATMADSYNSLWKQYEQVQKKNQPRSAIGILNQISAKARADKAYGQLIKAELEQVVNWQDLSGDSLQPQLQRLSLSAMKAEKDDRAAAAIYYSVLGRIYQKEFRYVADSMEVSKKFMRRSMQNPALLAAVKAENYAPLMIEGIDSHIFYNDLLHVLGFAAGDYKTLLQWTDARILMHRLKS